MKRNFKPLTSHLQREPIMFPNKEDLHIPKQIPEELSVRDDVEVAFHLLASENRSIE